MRPYIPTEGLGDIDRGETLLDRFPRRRRTWKALDPLMFYLTSDASAQTHGSVFDLDSGPSVG